jgi:hypothetical protein
MTPSTSRWLSFAISKLRGDGTDDRTLGLGRCFLELSQKFTPPWMKGPFKAVLSVKPFWT